MPMEYTIRYMILLAYLQPGLPRLGEWQSGVGGGGGDAGLLALVGEAAEWTHRQDTQLNHGATHTHTHEHEKTTHSSKPSEQNSMGKHIWRAQLEVRMPGLRIGWQGSEHNMHSVRMPGLRMQHALEDAAEAQALDFQVAQQLRHLRMRGVMARHRWRPGLQGDKRIVRTTQHSLATASMNRWCV